MEIIIFESSERHDSGHQASFIRDASNFCRLDYNHIIIKSMLMTTFLLPSMNWAPNPIGALELLVGKYF